MVIAVVGLVSTVALASCGARRRGPPSVPADTATRGTPVVESPSTPYATARAAFRTRLVAPGPSPQPWSPAHPPGGVQEISFRSGDLTLRAWLGGPAQRTAPAPAVLFLHGGFAFGEEDWDAVRPFIDAGFVVMVPMLRGENGQPGNFTLFVDEVDDALAAAEVLAARPEVDPKRLYVSGHSAGGVLAAFSAMRSARFRAAAPLAAAPDATVFRGTDFVPFDPADDDEFRLRSPLAFATSFTCPVRLFVGAEEELFVDDTHEIARRARSAGLDVEAVVVDGDHFSMVTPAIPLAIDFFRQQQP